MTRSPSFTKEELVDALTRAEGDLLEAALLLRTSERPRVAQSTVHRAMKRYGIEVRATREVVETASAA